jgi:hypothetical protein
MCIWMYRFISNPKKLINNFIMPRIKFCTVANSPKSDLTVRLGFPTEFCFVKIPCNRIDWILNLHHPWVLFLSLFLRWPARPPLILHCGSPSPLLSLDDQPSHQTWAVTNLALSLSYAPLISLRLATPLECDVVNLVKPDVFVFCPISRWLDHLEACAVIILLGWIGRGVQGGQWWTTFCGPAAATIWKLWAARWIKSTRWGPLSPCRWLAAKSSLIALRRIEPYEDFWGPQQ